MTLTPDQIKEAWTNLATAGQWTPPKGDALHECAFSRAGFRSYSLSPKDGTWKLVISRLDFGHSDPKALLEVYAPGHDSAFPDLGDFVFKHSIGTNGGTNMNQAVKQLHETIGAAEADWRRRINYLVAQAQKDSAGRVNGSFVLDGVPDLPVASPYIFQGRIRRGRTMSLFGPGSAGKTTIATGLLASLISGSEIIPGWRPTGKFNTLTLDWDEGREEESVRLYAISRAHQVSWVGARYHYKRMGRPLADLADTIGRYVADENIDVVLVSPVGRSIRQTEHGDPAGPIEELYEVLREFGTTNILIDHVTGANIKGGADREYGAVRKRDNARGSYSVYAQFEEPGSRTVIIKNTKPDALAPAQVPIAVRIDFDPPWPDDNGAYDHISFHPAEVVESASDIQPRMGRSESQWQRLVRILREHGEQTTIGLCALSGFNANRVRDIVREARVHGFEVEYNGGMYSLREPEDG